MGKTAKVLGTISKNVKTPETPKGKTKNGIREYKTPTPVKLYIQLGRSREY